MIKLHNEDISLIYESGIIKTEFYNGSDKVLTKYLKRDGFVDNDIVDYFIDKSFILFCYDKEYLVYFNDLSEYELTSIELYQSADDIYYNNAPILIVFDIFLLFKFIVFLG